MSEGYCRIQQTVALKMVVEVLKRRRGHLDGYITTQVWGLENNIQLKGVQRLKRIGSIWWKIFSKWKNLLIQASQILEVWYLESWAMGISLFGEEDGFGIIAWQACTQFSIAFHQIKEAWQLIWDASAKASGSGIKGGKNMMNWLVKLLRKKHNF